MVFRLLATVGIWLVLWIASWRVFYGPLMRRNINYVDHFPVTSAYFLLLSVLVIFFFRNTLAPVVSTLTVLPFVILASVFLLQVVLYHLSRRFLRKPVGLIEKNPHEFFLTLDYHYLVSKSFEVLYQQVMIVVLILVINRETDDLIAVMIIYAVVFAVGHLPLLRLFGEQEKFFARFYTVAAMISAVVFPVLILRVNCGFVYSYIVHSIFYTLLAVGFWARNTVSANG